MVLCEERECTVCYRAYTRSGRIPRVLHCRHTFCAVCLEAMAVPKSGLQTVRCPLCRQMTCVGSGHKLQEALWVNSRLWDQIPDMTIEEEGDEEEEQQELERRRQRLGRKEKRVPEEVLMVEEGVDGEGVREGDEERPQGATRPIGCGLVSPSYRLRIRLPWFLKRLSFARQPQETIMPCSNVEMKSWRRLASADMI